MDAVIVLVLRGKDVDSQEPVGGQHGPVLLWGSARTHAEAVAAGGKVVEFGGDVGLHEGAVVDEAVDPVGSVIFRLDDEGGGGECVGLVCGEDLCIVWRHGEIGRVGEDGEVGASADLGVGLGCRWGGANVVIVGVGAEEDGEVGSGREAHDSNARRVEVPLGGVSASDAHGLLSVFQIRRIGGVVTGFAGGLGDPVLDQDAGDAQGVEPVAGIETLLVPGEALIPAAGKDEDCSAIALAVRAVEGERGDGDVGDHTRMIGDG